MNPVKALEGGLAGAVTVTLVHEAVRRLVPGAPRMDLLGMTALSRALNAFKLQTPDRKNLYWITMAGDIVANTLYYSLAGAGNRKNLLLRSAALGLAAGIGGVLVPKYSSLPERHSSRTPKTSAMTIGWYLLGGLTAGAVMIALSKKKKRNNYNNQLHIQGADTTFSNPAEERLGGFIE